MVVLLWQYGVITFFFTVAESVTLRVCLPGTPPELASVRGDQWGFYSSFLLPLFPSFSSQLPLSPLLDTIFLFLVFLLEVRSTLRNLLGVQILS